jgi:hypothetical protein
LGSYGWGVLRVGIQGARRYCVLSRLTFECRSDNITVAPDEATPTHRAELSNEMPNSEGTMLRPFSRMHAPRFRVGIQGARCARGCVRQEHAEINACPRLPRGGKAPI